MGPCYYSCLTISTSPRLTHDFSSSWRVPATAVRKQEGGRTGQCSLPGIYMDLISPSPWMPTQGPWQSCCPTFEQGAKGLELESGTLFLLKGNLLGHIVTTPQFPILTMSVASKHSEISACTHTDVETVLKTLLNTQHKQCLWGYMCITGTQTHHHISSSPQTCMDHTQNPSFTHIHVHGFQSLFIWHMETPLASAVQILHTHYMAVHTTVPQTLFLSCWSCVPWPTTLLF